MFRFGDECVGIPYELGDLDETYTRSGRIVYLGDLVARGHRRVIYEYDFGDGWTHTIEIDDVRDDEGPSLACLDGARACPPEDCGGVDGDHHLLEILFDPTHQESEDSRRWVGPAFEPGRFDLQRVNQQMGRWQSESAGRRHTAICPTEALQSPARRSMMGRAGSEDGPMRGL